MIVKRVIIGKREILEFGQIQVREDTIIEEDGKEIMRTYHRYVVEPDQDSTNFALEVKRIALLEWTPEVIDKFKQIKARNSVPFGG